VSDIGINNFKVSLIGGDPGFSLFDGRVTDREESLIGSDLLDVVLIGLKSGSGEVLEEVLEEVGDFLGGGLVGEVLGD